MGGQSVLFAKSTAELLKAAIHGEDSLSHVETYLIVIALVSCLLCQIHYLNCGLLHYDALSVVPIYQAYWIISGVLGGVIYFQEIRTFTVQQACMFVVGITTTIFGVYLLSQRRPVAQMSMKRKLTLDRGGKAFSTSGEFTLDSIGKSGPLPTVQETPVKTESPPASMPTINENESELSTTEDSENDDENQENNEDNSEDVVSRHVIDNYLDMSATMGFTEILTGLGFQSGPQRVLLSRRPSARNFGYGDLSYD
jgi:magnesium transporter